MSTVTVRDLRNHSAEVLARVARGETLVVTRDGSPVAQMAPLPRPAVTAAELVDRRRRLPAVDPVRLAADLDAILQGSL